MNRSPNPLLIVVTFLIAACGGSNPETAALPLTAIQTQSTFTYTPAATQTRLPQSTDTPSPTAESTSFPEASAIPVSFAKDIMPILNASCNTCHGIEQVKEGLDMTSYENLMAGSFNGPVIVPGNAAESFLVQQVRAGEMPKRGEKLTGQQIQRISDWINGGALKN